jgi:hypothetical protein
VTDQPPLDAGTQVEYESIREPKPWDRAATIALLVPLALLAMQTSYSGMIAATTAAPCGAGCSAPMLTAGMLLTTFSPMLLFIVAMFFGIRGILRRRHTFWIPLAAIIAVALLWFLGAGLTAIARG